MSPSNSIELSLLLKVTGVELKSVLNNHVSGLPSQIKKAVDVPYSFLISSALRTKKILGIMVCSRQKLIIIFIYL